MRDSVTAPTRAESTNSAAGADHLAPVRRKAHSTLRRGAGRNGGRGLFCRGRDALGADGGRRAEREPYHLRDALHGVGVGLTFPTLMGAGTASLPPSSFATGSGVINMIRQAAIAIGVALFVAIIGTPASLPERVAAYHRAWWMIAAFALASIDPNQLIIGRRAHDRPAPRGDRRTA